MLRLLIDRREQLAVTRTETINRLHQLLLELIPGGAKKNLSIHQARDLLAGITAPARTTTTDWVTATRRHLAEDLLDEITTLDTKMKTAEKQLSAVLAGTGSRLQNLRGIGPLGYSPTSPTSAASPAADTSPPTTAPHPSTRPPATTSATACPAKATAASTGSCTSPPSPKSATTAKDATTTNANSPKAKHPKKPPAPSNDACPTSSGDR